MKINPKRKPDYNRMVELLDYNQETGVFKWKVKVARPIKIGTVAGYIRNGYRYITIDKVDYAAHRLAMYYIHKYWPENEIDHINRVKDDNRICNLREVSTSCNQRNAKNWNTNTSGVKGVCWDSTERKWFSYIYLNNKCKSLGKHKDFTEAVFARYAGEQALGWKSCDANSPAYRYLNERRLVA